MKKWLENHIYITEHKFGVDDYRKPIIWVDKSLIVLGLIASIIGQILCFLWCIKFTLSDFTDLQPIRLLLSGSLMWICGAYFKNTGNRGLIYHHMDFLAEYLEKKTRENSSLSDNKTN